MAEISNRAVATAAGGAMLAVALAFIGNADAQERYDRAVRCDGKTVRSVQLVTRSRDAAVFRKVKPRADGVRVPFTYACLVRGGSIRRLDRLTRDQQDSAEDAQLAGRFAGFRRRFPVSESDVASDIVVLDLKTGAVRSGHTALPGRPQEGDVLTLVVKRNGSVAWTAIGVRGQELSVWRLDGSPTGPRELDRGAAIDHRSLRLSTDRRTVLWRSGGQEKSAAID